MNNNYLLVSEVNKIIKNIFDRDDFLKLIFIKGEISNIKESRGHLYFNLKDELSRINAVIFNYEKITKGYMPKDGDSVLVRGRVSVYEATGNYQIYIDEINEDGIGKLYILFEELKRKLASEGLFDETNKKRIPKIPKKIGIITSTKGAAITDIISTINRRFPLPELYIFHTIVQGDSAGKDIVQNIEQANTFDLDVIILGRGGGSIEDLWAFNEEIVARAIYASKIPIVSAVGHEIDFTISDFVSDLRAPTPTGAAELVVPDKNELIRYLRDAVIRINNSFYNRLDSYKERLDKYKSSYVLNNPFSLYEKKEMALDSVIDRINSNIKEIVTRYTHRLDTIKLKLDLLNPENILGKGYSIIKKDNKIIKSVDSVNTGDIINIILSKGNINTEVKEVNK